MAARAMPSLAMTIFMGNSWGNGWVHLAHSALPSGTYSVGEKFYPFAGASGSGIS